MSFIFELLENSFLKENKFQNVASIPGAVSF